MSGRAVARSEPDHREGELNVVVMQQTHVQHPIQGIQVQPDGN
jgi:hypothetical protein